MTELITSRVDPVCAFHGQRRSEHECLYCCLCYEDLTELECNINANGDREDVCLPCAAYEQQRLREKLESGIIKQWK